jgi:hypothetical protein
MLNTQLAIRSGAEKDAAGRMVADLVKRRRTHEPFR